MNVKRENNLNKKWTTSVFSSKVPIFQIELYSLITLITAANLYQTIYAEKDILISILHTEFFVTKDEERQGQREIKIKIKTPSKLIICMKLKFKYPLN